MFKIIIPIGIIIWLFLQLSTLIPVGNYEISALISKDVIIINNKKELNYNKLIIDEKTETIYYEKK